MKTIRMRVLDAKRVSVTRPNTELTYRYKYNLSKGRIEMYVSIDGVYFSFLYTRTKDGMSKKEWDIVEKMLRDLIKNPETAEII